MYPRQTLVDDVKKMDKIFRNHHECSSDGLIRTKNVVGGLVELLVQEFPYYDEKLLKKFAMCRTMRRMKWVQQQMVAHHKETLRLACPWLLSSQSRIHSVEKIKNPGLAAQKAHFRQK